MSRTGNCQQNVTKNKQQQKTVWSQIIWCQTIETLVHQQAQLVGHSRWEAKPVQRVPDGISYCGPPSKLKNKPSSHRENRLAGMPANRLLQTDCSQVNCDHRTDVYTIHIRRPDLTLVQFCLSYLPSTYLPIQTTISKILTHEISE